MRRLGRLDSESNNQQLNLLLSTCLTSFLSDVCLICLFWDAFQPPSIHSLWLLCVRSNRRQAFWNLEMSYGRHTFIRSRQHWHQLISRDWLGACNLHRGAPVIVYFSDIERMCDKLSKTNSLGSFLIWRLKKNLFLKAVWIDRSADQGKVDLITRIRTEKSNDRRNDRRNGQEILVAR